LQDGSHSPEKAQRVLAELTARDQRDRTRSASPLVAAPDAVHIDTTHKSIDDVVAEVEQLVKRVDRR
jgi:cytidylate kinase